MNFRTNAECPRCFEVYKADDFSVCPNCDLEREW
jgi:hypothetical protein